MNDDTTAHERIAALSARAEAGDTQAMFDLALLHDLPEKPGAPLDLQKARDWYTRAADAGHAWAQFALGHMHDRAEAGPRNHLAARRWYEAAARQGVSEAQMQFARMLQAGLGGPADAVEAASWYERAAHQGHEVAATRLALMHLSREVPEAELQKALSLLEFAADKLDGLAHLVLADIHMNGLAGERHGGLALVHYCVATLLLPAGTDADRALDAKEALIARQPRLRDEYEEQARRFVAERTPRGPDGLPIPPGSAALQ
jgi:uncharacterized protein